MSTETLENPFTRSISSVRLRTPQQKDARKLPEGTRVVSADSHWEVNGDIFYERLPASVKSRAPRYWFDAAPMFGDPSVKPKTEEEVALRERERHIRFHAVGAGAWDMDIRKRDLDAEGVEMELMYPHSMLQFIRDPDMELQEHIYWAYNEYIADVSKDASHRFFGVGICSNWWEPAKAHRAIRQIVDLGLRTFMIPTATPGKTADGKPISYGGPEMDAFWSEAADAGVPVAFHVGENLMAHGRGALGATLLQTFSPFRKPFGEIVFGGVLDRHPKLQIVFAEGGIAWIPPMLQDAEAVLDCHRVYLDVIPERRPTEYWCDNCFATFQFDPLGLSQLGYIGVDRVMWASDYPHNEGTLGYGWDSIMNVVDTVDEDAARQILGGTAIELYGLDRQH